MAMNPLVLGVVVAAIAGAAIAVLANTVTVPLGVTITLVMFAIGVPLFFALRADAHRHGRPTRF